MNTCFFYEIIHRPVFKKFLCSLAAAIEVIFIVLCLRGSTSIENCKSSNLFASNDSVSVLVFNDLSSRERYFDSTVHDEPYRPEAAPQPTSVPELTPIPAPTPAPTPVQTPTPTVAQPATELPVQKGQSLYPISWADKSRTEVCITFDDGYDAASLSKALEVLKKANIKCTFFIIGEALRKNADLWKQAVKDGHQICNHTNSHKFLSNTADEVVKNEILGWEQAAKDILGEEYLERMRNEFPYFRHPGGSGSSDERIRRIVNKMGYKAIGWSDETVYSVLRHHNLGNESVDPIAEQIQKHVVENAANGSIILLHFNQFDITRLEKIISGIIEKGLTIKLVSEILR